MHRSLTVILIFALSVPALADDRAAARAHFRAGLKAFNGGDLDGAVVEYKAAYALSHEPALLFNLAQVYRLKKDGVQALESYRAYLQAAPRAKNRADVEERIAELEAQKPSPPPPPPVVEPTPPGPAPVEPPLPEPSPPPPPAVAVEAPKPEPAAPVDTDRGATLRRGGLITMGAGGVLAAATVVLLVSSHSAGQTITDESKTGRTTWSDDDRSRWDRGQLFDKLAIATGIGAGAAVATGAVLYYLGVRREHVDVAAVPHAGGAGFVVTCGF